MNLFNEGLNRLRGSLVENPKPTTSHSNSALNAPLSSADVFIKAALDRFMNAKESKKMTPLREAAKTALTALEAAAGHPNPSESTLQTIFIPFQLACQSKIPSLVSVSIDCLGKLFPYDYWGKPNDGGQDSELDVESMDSMVNGGSMKTTLISVEMNRLPSESVKRKASSGDVSGILLSLVIETICECFSNGDLTDDKVQLQIIKVSYVLAHEKTFIIF